jgi:glucokinase
MDNMNTVIAIDLGGTQIRAAVVNEAGTVLSRARADTPTGQSADVGIAQMIHTTREALAGVSNAKPLAIGLSSPGPIDPRHGILFSTPNIPGWHNVPLAQRMSEAFGLSCFAGNDANLAAVAEWQFGAGRGCTDLVYLTVSTGIGGGVISSGKLIDGKRGLAVEAGHILVALDGPPCGCGSYGCLESFASGTGIARAMEERLATGEASSLTEERGRITARMVVAAMQAGDELAAAVFTRAMRYLGIGCASFINLFDPQKIILGGGVTKAGSALFDIVREVAFKRCMRELREGVEIVPAALRDDVGLLGAAGYAFEHAVNLV